MVSRAIPVRAEVTDIATSTQNVDVSYRVDGATQQAIVLANSDAVPIAGSELVLVMDPNQPTTVWLPGRTPPGLPDRFVPLLLVGGGLNLITILVSPVAFARPPVLEEISPDGTDTEGT